MTKLNKLNEYLLLKIFNKLSFKKKIIMNNISKRIKNITHPILSDLLDENKEWILDNYNLKIIKLFGGIDNMKYYSHLRWKNKYIGCTNYIDRIKSNNVREGVMLGKDNLGRPFVVVKTQELNKKNKNVDVIFQRYTNTKNIWTNGQFECNGFINEGGHLLVNNIINHKFLESNIKSLVNNYNLKSKISSYSEIDIPYWDGSFRKINLKICI